MLTPVKYGGFGMLDFKLLGESLDLRSYGRLMETKHPFLTQLKPLIMSEDFFNLQINVHVDKKLKNSLKLLNKDRRKLFKWPLDTLVSNTHFCSAMGNLKLRTVLNRAGRQCIQFFNIHTRCPAARVSQLTIAEFQSIARHLIYPELGAIINELLTRRVMQPPDADVNAFYPTKNHQIVKISGLTSKALRINQHVKEDQMICVYKIGLILTPGELISWTYRASKLTSTRHKNIILRVAHGDIFSNDRLFRFNLIDSPACRNCNELNESIQHRILECQLAANAWTKLNESKSRLGLSPLTDLTLENILGAKDNLNKIEFALNAELIHKLTSRSEHPCPDRLVRSVIKLIYCSEYLSQDLRNAFENELNRS